MSLETHRVEELFHAAQQIADPTERQTWLENACVGDGALRQRVQSLLSAAAEASQFLNQPAVELRGDSSAATQCLNDTDGHTQIAEQLSFLQPSTRPDSLGRLGHYEVLELVGQGGFGIVLRAFDEKLHRVVALKVLAPELAANGAARKRFVREARTAAAIKNEHVVGIYEVAENAQPPYLAMEMIEGKSLQQKIDQQGPLTLAEILRIGLQTAEGLAAAHKQGLVHRDIKPANILLENGVERVKITDFGLARAVDDASVTQSGTVAGTPMYMSPEQAEGLAIDHRSDLFSLGTVLYAMCTGHPAFRASGTHAVLKRVIDATPRPIHETNPEIPEWLEAIVAKLHAKQPADRFQTASEVAELLEQHLAHLQQPSRFTQPPLASEAKFVMEPKPGKQPGGFPHISPRFRRLIVISLLINLVLALAIWILFGFFLPANRGWSQLFNGKDFTGWHAHPEETSWNIDDGAISVAPKQSGSLISQRNDYANFHLRGEVFLRRGGIGTIQLRKPTMLSPPGFEVQFAAGRRLTISGSSFGEEIGQLLYGERWIPLEIVVRGNSLQVFANGQSLAKRTDPEMQEPQGHIVLEQVSFNGLIKFRNLELRELPADKPAAKPSVKLPQKLPAPQADAATVRKSFDAQLLKQEHVKAQEEIAALRELIDALQRKHEQVAAQFEVGRVSSLSVTVAEAELIEARIQLAERESPNPKKVLALLRELIAARTKERELTEARIEAGVELSSTLSAVEVRLAKAKARLAREEAAWKPKE